MRSVELDHIPDVDVDKAPPLSVSQKLGAAASAWLRWCSWMLPFGFARGVYAGDLTPGEAIMGYLAVLTAWWLVRTLYRAVRGGR